MVGNAFGLTKVSFLTSPLQCNLNKNKTTLNSLHPSKFLNHPNRNATNLGVWRKFRPQGSFTFLGMEETVPREELDWRSLYPENKQLCPQTVFKLMAVDATAKPSAYNPLPEEARWKARLGRIQLPPATKTVRNNSCLHVDDDDGRLFLEVPVKRGRGRPPRDALKTKQMAFEVAVAAQQDVSEKGISFCCAATAGEVNLEDVLDYEADEQDVRWLLALNNERAMSEAEEIKLQTLELIIDKLEKKYHLLVAWPAERHRARYEEAAYPEVMQCEICGDTDTTNSNVLVMCDGCDLAVHQECYGVPHVPEGPWHCRRCMLIGTPTSGGNNQFVLDLRKRGLCVLCPWPEGALKQSTDRRWVHSVCAHWLYPLTQVLNGIYQEPIDMGQLHRHHLRKVCSLCRVPFGAPAKCKTEGCSAYMHPLCARKAGLLLDYKSRNILCRLHSPLSENRVTGKIGIGPVPPLHVIRKGPRQSTTVIAPRIIIDQVCEEENGLDRELVERVARYWSLKRELQKGQPLLRRLREEPWSSMPGSIGEGGDLSSRIISEARTINYLRNDLMQLKEIFEMMKFRESLWRARLEIDMALLDLQKEPETFSTRFSIPNSSSSEIE